MKEIRLARVLDYYKAQRPHYDTLWVSPTWTKPFGLGAASYTEVGEELYTRILDWESSELVEQPEERFEATEERLNPLPQIPHGEVRIVLDLEGALLELPTPEGASATQAWLTVEERAEEGAAISRHRVWITSFPDGSFHVDRILE